eukprot:359437-Chlamydomonas_euryale.AAC.7
MSKAHSVGLTAADADAADSRTPASAKAARGRAGSRAVSRALGDGEVAAKVEGASPMQRRSSRTSADGDGVVAPRSAKKDYANWAAATAMYRAESAAAAAKSVPSTPAAPGAVSRETSGNGATQGGAPGVPGASEGGAQVQVLISRGPDGSKGFGLGRGRALALAPPV